MARRVVITTPLPSTESVAAELGVSQKRVRELRKLIGFDPKRAKTRSAKPTKLTKKNVPYRARRGRVSSAELGYLGELRKTLTVFPPVQIYASFKRDPAGDRKRFSSMFHTMNNMSLFFSRLLLDCADSASLRGRRLKYLAANDGSIG